MRVERWVGSMAISWRGWGRWECSPGGEGRAWRRAGRDVGMGTA